jgi:hypothetical protein
MAANRRQVKPYTWADLGYRRLGSITLDERGEIDGQLIRVLTQIGGYDVEASCWIRQKGRKSIAFRRASA